MRIILKQDFESIGFEGDTVDVARGYARNYLIPKGIAAEATHANLKALEMRKDKIMARRMKDKEEAERVKEKISQLTVGIRQKAGAEGKLYGSVTTIRALGEFDVAIRLYPEVMATIKVIVEQEEKKA